MIEKPLAPALEINRLLVANRGEIAARIFRTCDRLGIETVAVCTPDDRGALHTRRAGEVHEVASYLSLEDLTGAAVRSGADAIHPGYGFLAENAGFARAVEDAGLAWVGPPAEAIRAAGDKLAAKRRAQAAGVPVLATDGAFALGFPLLVKAAAGGGGRGMRVVHAAEELEAALESAEREARAAFGEGAVFLERYLGRPRHVEVQILGDDHGAVLALGERECSIQRRHQKVLEESPAPGIGQDLREALVRSAVTLAHAVGYKSLGTVEFLVDGDTFYFLELNARIQVEHPVTEAVSGIDLVEQQLLVASGAPLRLPFEPAGHAVEVRLYAEHPRSFLPQPGQLERLELPESIRVDQGVEAGDEVLLGYDPLIAKLIAHAGTRADALDQLARALAETHVSGVVTNLPFLRWLVAHPDVRRGDTTTAFLAEHPPLSRHGVARGPWAGRFRLNGAGSPRARRTPPEVEQTLEAGAGSASTSSSVTAPTPGTVVRVLAREGERVVAREPLLVLEAMKMETPLVAPYDGVVRRVHVAEGERVSSGMLLVELSGDAEEATASS